MKNKDLLAENNNSENNSKLTGKVALVGFEVLDESEQEIVKKIVENYIKKFGSVADFQEIKISLRQHKHGKTFKHEVNAFAIFKQGKFESDVTEWNLYIALSMVCDKILTEVEHKTKKEM